MKILHLVPAYYPATFWGGPIVSVGLLCKELKKLGEDVEVYTTAIGLEKNQYTENFVDGVKVSYFKYLKFGKWAIPIGFIKKLQKTAENFDIIHIHQIWDPIVWFAGFILIKKRKKAKNEQRSILDVKRAKLVSQYVIAPRGSIDPVLIKKKNYFIKKIFYWLFIKRIFKRANGFHFTSEYEKEQFNKFTKNQFANKQNEIIFNPLDISEFQKDIDKNILDKWRLLFPRQSALSPCSQMVSPLGDSRRARESASVKEYFLYLGRINWKKGIEFLINGFAKFISVNPRLNSRQSAYLVIAGPDENNYQNKLEKLIKEKGISDKVIFTGLVKGDDKIVLLKNAKAFILPSFGENFGIAVAEALACGTLVIISKFVGIVNIIEKYNAGLVCELDENDLMEKMQKILNDNFQKELSINGKKLVEEEFNTESIAKKMIMFYNELDDRNLQENIKGRETSKT